MLWRSKHVHKSMIDGGTSSPSHEEHLPVEAAERVHRNVHSGRWGVRHRQVQRAPVAAARLNDPGLPVTTMAPAV